MPTFTVYKGSKEGTIIESETTRPDLSSDEVLISITASGLCGSDLLFKGNDVRTGNTSKLSSTYTTDCAFECYETNDSLR